MKKAIYLLVLLLGSTSLSVSQTTSRLPCIDKTFSIVAHIVRDSLGDPGFIEADILKNVDSLNKNFAPICVSFEICEFKYIDNFMYLEVDEDLEWEEMQVLYNLKNRINIYYVNRITNPAGASGFAGFEQIMDSISSGIVISAASEKTLSHEMGHYFGLYHTFETKFGSELVDGSNCLTAGDKICDTPADPFLKNSIPLNYVAACKFISTDKDANGQYYDAIVNNIMSYYPSTCECEPGFTSDQYRKMVDTYLSNIGMW